MPGSSPFTMVQLGGSMSSCCHEPISRCSSQRNGRRRSFLGRRRGLVASKCVSGRTSYRWQGTKRSVPIHRALVSWPWAWRGVRRGRHVRSFAELATSIVTSGSSSHCSHNRSNAAPAPKAVAPAPDRIRPLHADRLRGACRASTRDSVDALMVGASVR